MFDKYINSLVGRGCSAAYIKGLESVYKHLATFCQAYGVSVDPQDWDKKIIITFYRYLRAYRYSSTDPQGQAVIRRLMKCTVSLYMGAVKNYVQYLYECGHLESNPMDYVTVAAVKKSGLKHDVKEEDINRLVSVISTAHAFGYRDRTIIEVVYGAGLREGEVHRLDVADLLFDERLIFVKGKGGKERVVPMGKNLCHYLRQYVEHYRPKLLCADNFNEQAVFVGSWSGRRLFKDSIGRIVKKYARRAGVYHISTHKLRHAMALHMLRNGCDIRYIQEILGHEKLQTTTIYTKVFDYDLIRQVEKYHPGNYTELFL